MFFVLFFVFLCFCTSHFLLPRHFCSSHCLLVSRRCCTRAGPVHDLFSLSNFLSRTAFSSLPVSLSLLLFLLFPFQTYDLVFIITYRYPLSIFHFPFHTDPFLFLLLDLLVPLSSDHCPLGISRPSLTSTRVRPRQLAQAQFQIDPHGPLL